MFDAIVIGSGMSGGIVAKELCERGLKVLVLERGRDIDPTVDYSDMQQPWEVPTAGLIPQDELENYPIQSQCYAMTSANQGFWINDKENPYTTPEGKPFTWIRGDQKGGRSIMWGRQTYRLSPQDFEANAKDGHGSDWPIRYDDLAPWYDHIEEFIGVSGSTEGLDQLPDGKFLPPFALNDTENIFKEAVESRFPGRKVIPGRVANLSESRPQHAELGRAPCQVRSLCERGCSFKAYHSSLNSSLPAAERTGNLTLITDALVHSIVHDPASGKVTGVRVVDRNTMEATTHEAKVIFSNASALGTAQILLNSRSDAFPNGLANSSDQVGRNIMDHIYALSTAGIFPDGPDTTYFGRRPTGLYIPRFRNVTEEGRDYVRGYGYQGAASRVGWRSAANGPGVGVDLKDRVRQLGPWMMYIGGFGEMLPYESNRLTLSETETDKWGLPIPHIDVEFGDNERKMSAQILEDGKAMIEAAGGIVVSQATEPGTPGLGIHEMGTARMGTDPSNSVLNKWNQCHDVPNLFITDGAAMASSACQNPSLTYMALSARAADAAASMLQEGAL